MPKLTHSAPQHFTTPRWVTTQVCSICTTALAGCGGLCQACHDGSQPTKAEEAIIKARAAAVRPSA